MQLAQRVRIFNRHFRRELAAALAGADLFTARSTVHVTAAFQFDEIAAVAEHDALVKQGSDGFHAMVSVFAAGLVRAGCRGCLSQQSAATDTSARKIPLPSRALMRSPRKKIATGTLTSG